MAGILVSDGSIQGTSRGIEARFDKVLVYIADEATEALGALGVGRIIAQKVPVLLHVGAATGCIDDDRLRCRQATFRASILLFHDREEVINVVPSECARLFDVTAVRMEGTAADLTGGCAHADAVAAENPGGSVVGVAVAEGHNAASEQ